MFSGQLKVIVAPQDEVFDLARSYANLQRDFGNVERWSFDHSTRRCEHFA